MRLVIGLLLYLYAGFLLAQESVTICYGYGCLVQEGVQIKEGEWRKFTKQLSSAVNAAQEREMLAGVVGDWYALAGRQTPVHNDRGGNYADEGVSGAMDCIDHSTSSTRFLRVLERRGALRWHRVLEPQLRSRFYLFEHYSAAIEEINLDGAQEASQFVVDSWFVDNGKPAVILPLEEWNKGAGPDV